MKLISFKYIFILLLLTIIANNSFAQYPGSGQIELEPYAIPKFVDYLPHFAGLRVNAKQGQDLIIKGVMVKQVALSTGTVLENGIVGTDPDAGYGNYLVYSLSNDNGNNWTPPLWPSYSIEAQRGNPINMKVRNNLYGVTYKDVNIAADQTTMMASGVPIIGNPLTDPYNGPIPMSLHLHGGEVQSGSDGGPYAWFTPGYKLKGSGFSVGVDSVMHYPNKQEAATLWFHEHSQLGLTHLNVFAGMAGFYFLRGSDEENDKLPGFSNDDLVQEITPHGKSEDLLHIGPYLPEIELLIQDRSFDTKGELFYPIEPTNPEIHPFWAPEFFGDIITVNGKSWPYLSVAPRKYRFHLLNGSNARFYNIWLQNPVTKATGPEIIQVGSDGGLFDNPVLFNSKTGQKLLLGPGERADVIIDFSSLTKDSKIIMMNDAAAPYPDGDFVKEGGTDEIIQFEINGKMVSSKDLLKPGNDLSTLPQKLRQNALVKLTDFQGRINSKPDVTRQIVLNEVASDDGPLMVLLNNSRYEEEAEMPGMFGGLTEKPVEGETEKWQFINTTGDAHPLHIHLIQFQVVSRQKFNADRYMNDYMKSFMGINGGMPGMYMGGEGPPFKYETKNSDGAIGGNLAVSPYLQGPIKGSEPNEVGWKDVIKSYPGEVLTLMIRFAPVDLPLSTPKSLALFDFDPSIGPGYMWHCHILEHEDNDMMRPMNIQANPSRPNSKSISQNSNKDFLLKGLSLDSPAPTLMSTTSEIRFTTPNDGHVNLTLYNIVGTKVHTFIDSESPAGTQTVNLTNENLASGTYLCVLRAGSAVATRKLIIQK
jgi:spore coat protein A, manganese oxidase